MVEGRIAKIGMRSHNYFWGGFLFFGGFFNFFRFLLPDPKDPNIFKSFGSGTSLLRIVWELAGEALWLLLLVTVGR